MASQSYYLIQHTSPFSKAILPEAFQSLHLAIKLESLSLIETRHCASSRHVLPYPGSDVERHHNACQGVIKLHEG